MQNPTALKIDISQLMDLVFIQDMDLKLAFVSPSVTEMFGYTVEEALKLKMADFMRPDSLEKSLQAFQDAFNQARTEVDFDIPLMTYAYIRKDGSTFGGELKVSFLRDDSGRLIGSQGVLRNIDERKKAEKKQQQSRLKFQTLFNISPQAIALTSLSTGKFIEVNDKLCELTQYSKDELLENSSVELGFYSEENRQSFLNELRSEGEVQGFEMDFKVKDGSTINTLMSGKILKMDDELIAFTVFYDKTREKRLEYQFLQAQKMEAIGSLAGGIAHDFNNLLMGIQGKVSLMRFKTDTSHPHHPMLADIEKNVQSCSELTQQLLGYARKEKPAVTTLCLNDLIDETANSFQRVRKQIRIRKNLTPDLFSVDADLVQMEQVLYNLYVNAADAMPAGGSLSIKTANVSKKRMEGRSYKPKKDSYVAMVIADTGTGMDPNTLSHIFEPFFTTKEKGKGTGLGLASAYGIIKGHGGYIDVDSALGKGTTFHIYLPASDKSAGDTSQCLPEFIKSEGTILLVDDEAEILEVASQMLEQMGFTVIMAKSGPAAIETFKKQKDGIDLVILDFIMPDMGGGEVYDSLKKISADVKVILSSGYGIEKNISDIMQRGCMGFIQKPFTLGMLSQKINEVFKKKPTG
jgi:two-component system, cell cycle sensor histidine kinase and response regulator CckA